MIIKHHILKHHIPELRNEHGTRPPGSTTTPTSRPTRSRSAAPSVRARADEQKQEKHSLQEQTTNNTQK